MYLSLVIPTYNEERKIARDIEEAFKYLSVQSFNSEVLIVNDGSLDATFAAVKKNIQELPPSNKVVFKALGYQVNRGKGYAVKYGIENASGEIIAFADSGLCVPFRYIFTGIEKIQRCSA